jgi:hypothetical protein
LGAGNIPQKENFFPWEQKYEVIHRSKTPLLASITCENPEMQKAQKLDPAPDTNGARRLRSART